MRIRKPKPSQPKPASPLVAMSMQEYLLMPVQSSSGIKAFGECYPANPRRYFDLQKFERESTAPQLWGNSLHARLLEGRVLYVEYPRTYTDAKGNIKPWNNNATVCKEWCDNHPAGTIFCSFEEAQELERAVQSALTVFRPAQSGLVEHVTTGEILGVKFKIRPDYVEVAGDTMTVVDVKTTSAPISRWGGEVAKWRYDIQQEVYTRVLKSHGYKVDFSFVVVESQPPYHAMRTKLGPMTMRDAELAVNEWVKAYKQCSETGQWDGYAPDVIEKPAHTMRHFNAEMETMTGDTL